LHMNTNRPNIKVFVIVECDKNWPMLKFIK
jgi:hypothetical protein